MQQAVFPLRRCHTSAACPDRRYTSDRILGSSSVAVSRARFTWTVFFRLALTRAGLLRRNNMVYSQALAAGVPLVIVMGGGCVSASCALCSVLCSKHRIGTIFRQPDSVLTILFVTSLVGELLPTNTAVITGAALLQVQPPDGRLYRCAHGRVSNSGVPCRGCAKRRARAGVLMASLDHLPSLRTQARSSEALSAAATRRP